MKKNFLVVFLVSNIFIGITSGQYSNSTNAYGDEFGPLQSGYTMGDFVRYSVTKINDLYGLIEQPEGATDILAFGENTYNLYNAIGYLYAGWALLNSRLGLENQYKLSSDQYLPDNDYGNDTRYKPRPTYDKGLQSGFSDLTSKWLTSYRIKGGLSKQLDNNVKCQRTILFPLQQTVSPAAVWAYVPSTTEYQGMFRNVLQAANQGDANYSNAASSCGWCSNTDNADYILAITPQNANYHMVLPTGQFFGARIAHILGAVVNDVPWSSDLSSSGATGALTSSATAAATTTTTSTSSVFTNPLISDSKSTLPMFAAMFGGPYKVADPQITEMIQPSMAHFGSVQSFINNLSKPTAGWSLQEQYLRKHILPTVSRLSTLCSYGLSDNTNTFNLIKIEDSNVTAYDNGLIFAIQNNTGDALTVNQIVATDSTTTPITTTSSKIGSLFLGANNHYLHTASLMSPTTATTPVTSPVLGNAIEIKDSVASSSVFIQVVTPAQLNAVVTNLNAAYGTSGSLAYNQINTYNAPSNAQYVLVTNFDTSAPITGSNYLMYRMQAINVEEFKSKPYFVTLQINKETVGYGLVNPDIDTNVSKATLISGNASTAILYPSIVSVKTFTWQSVLDKKISSVNALNYTAMPLLLIPDSVSKVGIAGLQAYNTIWTMAFAAALTEFSFNQSWGFGNFMDFYTYNLRLFDDGSAQQPPARVIIDGANQLQSGQSIVLNVGASKLIQGEDQYLALMGCDVWDFGSDFHQDIAVLNLYTDTSTNSVIPNQTGGAYINLGVTVGSPNAITLSGSTTPAQAYGVPYSNMMLFSLPTATLKAGVIGALSQPTSGNYQLIFTDQANNVLAVQKVFVDTTTQQLSPITVDFLHADDDKSWTFPVTLTADVTSVGVGQTKTFPLRYQAPLSPATNNRLSLLSVQAIAQAAEQAKLKSLTNFKGKNYTQLQSDFTKLGLKVNEAQGFNIGLNDGAVPASFSMYFESKLGFMFFKNTWNPILSKQSTSSTSYPLAPDISSYLKKGSWKTGISIMLWCLDAGGNVIFDLTGDVKPQSFYLIVYDTKTGDNLGEIAIPMSDATRNKTGFLDTNPWTNTIVIGGIESLGAVGTTFVYPAVFTLTSGKPVSINNTKPAKIKKATKSTAAAKTSAKDKTVVKTSAKTADAANAPTKSKKLVLGAKSTSAKAKPTNLINEKEYKAVVDELGAMKVVSEQSLKIKIDKFEKSMRSKFKNKKLDKTYVTKELAKLNALATQDSLSS